MLDYLRMNLTNRAIVSAQVLVLGVWINLAAKCEENLTMDIKAEGDGIWITIKNSGKGEAWILDKFSRKFGVLDVKVATEKGESVALGEDSTDWFAMLRHCAVVFPNESFKARIKLGRDLPPGSYKFDATYEILDNSFFMKYWRNADIPKALEEERSFMLDRLWKGTLKCTKQIRVEEIAKTK